VREKIEKPHFQVAAGLIWRQGRVLIAKRPEGRHLAGYWEFPGGKQKSGETLEACLEREIKEELGLRIRAIRPEMKTHYEYDTKKITLHFFHCIRLEGEPAALEGQELKWASPHELPSLVFPQADRKMVEYLSGRNPDIKEEHAVFYKHHERGFREPAEGVKLKTLVYGEKTSLCEFRLKKGNGVPLHSHPHEQTGYLVSGKLVLGVGDEKFEAEPGDSWCIPGDVAHSAEVLEEAVVIEAFSPVREDYLSEGQDH